MMGIFYVDQSSLDHGSAHPFLPNQQAYPVCYN